MAFVCPIHGEYAPASGTTVAMCPQCSSPTRGSILNDSPEAQLLKQALDRADKAERDRVEARAEGERMREALKGIENETLRNAMPGDSLVSIRNLARAALSSNPIDTETR